MGGVGLSLPDQTGARVARASPCALRVGFLSPSRAGGVVRSEFPGVRGGRVPVGGGEWRWWCRRRRRAAPASASAVASATAELKQPRVLG